MLNRIQGSMPSNNQPIQKSQTKNKAQLVPFKENIKIVSNAPKSVALRFIAELIDCFTLFGHKPEIKGLKSNGDTSTTNIKLSNLDDIDRKTLIQAIEIHSKEIGIKTETSFVKKKKKKS